MRYIVLAEILFVLNLLIWFVLIPTMFAIYW